MEWGGWSGVGGRWGYGGFNITYLHNKLVETKLKRPGRAGGGEVEKEKAEWKKRSGRAGVGLGWVCVFSLAKLGDRTGPPCSS